MQEEKEIGGGGTRKKTHRITTKFVEIALMRQRAEIMQKMVYDFDILRQEIHVKEEEIACQGYSCYTSPVGQTTVS